MIVPVIHLNGTSKQSLIEDHCGMTHFLRQAIEALAKCTPNGRDYPSGGWKEAMTEHVSRRDRLCDVLRELEELTMKIDEAGE